MREFDAVGLGTTCADYLIMMPRYPEIGEKLQVDLIDKQGGGIVGTSLVAMARLGANVSFIGKLGDDELGEFAINELEREGVDISGIVIQESAVSPVSYVMVDKKTNDRTIVWSQGSVQNLKPSEIHKEKVLAGKVLLVDDYEVEAAIAAASWARERGIRVILDAENVVEKTKELIKLSDVLKVALDFVEGFPGEDDLEKSALILRELGPSVVVITLGEKGSLCSSEAASFWTPGYRVDVIDTNGAGDVFFGALAYGLLQFEELRNSVEFANAVAALKCTQLGGRAGIPTFDETVTFIKTADRMD